MVNIPPSPPSPPPPPFYPDKISASFFNLSLGAERYLPSLVNYYTAGLFLGTSSATSV